MSDADRLYHLPAARSEDQRAYMEELEAAGVCVFCPEHFEAHHREPIAFSGEHWYVTENDYPYAGAAAHYLIVPHRHVTSFDELPDEAGAELWAIKRRLREQLAPLATATVERSRRHALQRRLGRASAHALRGVEGVAGGDGAVQGE